MKRLGLFAALVLIAAAAPAPAAGKRAMTVDDLFRFQRVSDPQVSPDGRYVVYVVGQPDMERNTVLSSLWLARTDGKAPPRQLTNAPGKKDRHPRWGPDSRHILFESNRSGEMQLWVIDTQGGEARQLTTISTGASTGAWSRDGRMIAFVSAVYPEYSEKPFKESDALNKKRQEEVEKGPVKAKTFTRLFYRHWDSYVEDKRQHLFVMPFNGGAGGEPRDVTPGDRDAFPTSSTFETGDNFTFSPDGKSLVFTAVPDKNEAWSTNYDLCRVPVTGGSTTWECLTKDNPAADSGPVFSPDGRVLAYRAQKKAGYEADRWELMLVDVAGSQKPVSLTAGLDRSIDSYAWAGNDVITYVAEDRATSPVFAINLRAKEGAPPSRLVEGGACSSLSWDAGGTQLAFVQTRLDRPAEVIHASAAPLPPTSASTPKLSEVRNLSAANAKLLAELDRPRPESVTVEGAGGTPMQMWILKPPGFDPKKKYPLAYLVHGGPQGAWDDGWSFRWNASLWAAQGYVVALPNPRGSTGFGQKYVDEISGDWGGKCYEDLMRGVDYLEKQPYIDRERMAAAGASFGGYMMNWFAVNTNRFKTLITHCSVWNFDSMYGTTDEIWFDEYEHGGPPWGPNRDSYEKHSPHRRAANLGKFRTPMLIIHNDLDFRCPIGQGHELFTALQRQGVESRFINFPDEGHWVLKPQNSRHWHNEVFTWLKKHVPPGGR